ncbi:TetR/AcrR family transcriptional regulator [Saccharothrix algeriensis]|uniref:AcrR family transcriptional regulator n=1 Tax=Saccharothrix algeriensis TaxID=173560 RepID=A0A8T8HRK8_9PSEU|nr:TetR/AcrR family transcriptional regulator [Saccharothrix algeriensis]MBM7812310.1 AcrR family transcriptional regulator [Saccharothrix algeriensis]QTR01087.1 TetR/AcrR family transcriptional regulator [Saccharothrix algeriensis]
MHADQPVRTGRAKRLPRAVRERQITDAAVEVFSRRGFHAASMDEISEVAGISKPMLYAYLGSKEELFATCIRREATRMVEAVATGVERDQPPDVQLWSGLRAFFGFVGGNRASWQVLHRQASSQGGPLAEESADLRGRAIGLVAGLLVGSSGFPDVPRPGDKEAESLAAALVGAGESLADWWLDNPEEPAGVVAARLMNLVWMGFGDLVGGHTWRPPSRRAADPDAPDPDAPDPDAADPDAADPGAPAPEAPAAGGPADGSP